MKPYTDKDWIIVRLMRAMAQSSDHRLKGHPDFVKTCVYMFKHGGEDLLLGRAPEQLREEDAFIRSLIDDKAKLEAENAKLWATLVKTFETLQNEQPTRHPLAKSHLVAEHAAKHGLHTINVPLTSLEPGDLSGFPQ